MKRFKEKVVVIIGAGSKIGRASAIRFAKEGAKVALVGSDTNILEQITEEFPQDHTWIHSGNHLTITCDVSQSNQTDAMIQHVTSKLGLIDTVVITDINHAFQNSQQIVVSDADIPIDETCYPDFLKNLLEALKPKKGNMIILPHPYKIDKDNEGIENSAYIDYKATKKLAQSLAIAYGEFKIRVNMVSTSISDIDNVIDKKNGSSHLNEDSIVKSNEPSTLLPLGKHVSTEDIAAAITFLASKDAAMITGINLIVDGGAMLANTK